MRKVIGGIEIITERCYAKTRSGGRCQRWPVPNGSGRCKLHGGASLRGEASGRWKHGKYSKVKTR